MEYTSSCLVLSLCLMFLSASQCQEKKGSSRINCPEGTNAYGFYCYYFNEDRETWVDADLFCQNMNSGHLVSVLNQAEGAFVASLIKETATSDSRVWVGLHDPQKNRRWRWSSGSLVSYKAWMSGAPSSTSSNYCVSLTSTSGFQRWKDENCESRFSFVCKFKK